MVKKFRMLSFGQICGVQSFRVAANFWQPYLVRAYKCTIQRQKHKIMSIEKSNEKSLNPALNKGAVSGCYLSAEKAKQISIFFERGIKFPLFVLLFLKL
jgi:hypothetical protein